MNHDLFYFIAGQDPSVTKIFSRIDNLLVFHVVKFNMFLQ